MSQKTTSLDKTTSEPCQVWNYPLTKANPNDPHEIGPVIGD